MNSTIVTGVIVPTITFFKKTGEISEIANRILLKHILTNKSDCIFVLGSTGEGLFFQDKPNQKNAYLQIVKNVLQDYKNTPLLVGAYGETPEDVVNDIKNTQKILPNVSFVVPPPTTYSLSSEEDQITFFKKVLSSTEALIYLYNNPGSFGGTQILLSTVQQLKQEYINLKGIKDSSASLDVKKEYVTELSSNFTVSCGKEGDIGKFLELIPKEKRQYAGIVPSIANIVNTTSKIYKYGVEGNDVEMLALQDELNSFRSNIYHSAVPNGKAQRGLKIALHNIYKKKGYFLPLSLTPSLIKPVSEDDIALIDKTVAEVTNPHINIVSDEQTYTIGKYTLIYSQFKKVMSQFSQLGDLDKLSDIIGPFDGKINSMYLFKFSDGKKALFRCRVSKAFRYEALVKEKILYAFLDKTFTKDTPKLGQKINELTNTHKGTHVFGESNPSIVPVQDLISYYEPSEEAVANHNKSKNFDPSDIIPPAQFPYISSIKSFMDGKSMYDVIQTIPKNMYHSQSLLALFKESGKMLGKLHNDVQFDSFYNKINEIGDESKKNDWIDLFELQWSTNIEDASQYNAFKPLLPKLENYYKKYLSLVEDECEAVLFHNDYQIQNLIVEENMELGYDNSNKFSITGVIDFDNWRIGPRAQDFVKMEYWSIQGDEQWKKEFFSGYSELYPITVDMKNKIGIYKVLWFILVYAFEMDKLSKGETNQDVDQRFPSAEKYITEIERILQG